MNTVFDIEQKQDSPEKLAAIANKDPKTVLLAVEFNIVVETIKILLSLVNDKLIVLENVLGMHEIDFNIDTHRITLTGNTTFSEINLPPVGFSKTITLHINGNFGVVFPASRTQYISGAYNGTAPLNTIVIETIGTKRKVQISQPD